MKTLSQLIGLQRGRRIIKKYFHAEYPDAEAAADTVAAIAIADSLSDKQLLAVQGVGLMTIQAIRRACEDRSTEGLEVDLEKQVVDLLADAWNSFLKLRVLHADDVPDFRKAIHDAQRIVQSRPALK